MPHVQQAMESSSHFKLAAKVGIMFEKASLGMKIFVFPRMTGSLFGCLDVLGVENLDNRFARLASQNERFAYSV